MADRFLDPIMEPILWLLVSVIFALVGIYFIYKYRKIHQEAKPFILGVAIFAFFFMIGRTFETIRRYFGIGAYYDIIDSNFSLTGLNLTFHLLYFIIPYTGNLIFYYVFEKYVLKKGANKNSRYILTIFAGLEMVFLCMLHVTTGNLWGAALIGAFTGFFIIGFFPLFLFIYLSTKESTKERKIAWLVVMLGFVLFIVGTAFDLEEAYSFTQNLPGMFIHYSSPIFMASGAALMGSGFAILYRNV